MTKKEVLKLMEEIFYEGFSYGLTMLATGVKSNCRKSHKDSIMKVMQQARITMHAARKIGTVKKVCEEYLKSRPKRGKRVVPARGEEEKKEEKND